MAAKGVDPEEETAPLSKHLDEWLRFFGDPLMPSQKRSAKLFHGIYTNKLSLSAAVFVAGTVLVDALWASSLREAQVGARLVLSAYSSFAAFVCLSRNALIRSCLRVLADVAREMESAADAEGMAGILRAARTNGQYVRLYVVYAVFAILGTVLTLFTIPAYFAQATVRLLQLIGQRQEEAGGEAAGSAVDAANTALLHRAALPLRLYVSSTMILCLCTMQSLMIIVHMTTGELYRQIGRKIQFGPCDRRWIEVQTKLIRAGVLANRVFGDTLTHFLVAIVIVPVLSTVDVVMNGREADRFSLAVAPVTLMWFVPMCEAGSEHESGRMALHRTAYWGPWLEEPPAMQQLRRSVMLAAQSRGALFRALGIGVLNRQRCGRVLRSWFSFVQAVSNLQQGRALNRSSGRAQ